MAGQDKRALIIDDNESTRLLVEAVLRRRGYSTDCAADGQEAIYILQRDDGYDLIVLDLMMPGVDGYGVLDYLRTSHHGYPGSLRKIIIVTATPALIDDDRLPKDLCEVLVKPFTGERLLHSASL